MKKNQIKKKWNDFIIKTAPFFEKVGNLSQVQRLLICVAAIGIVGGAYYYLFYMPRQDNLNRLEKRHQDSTNQLQTYKRKAARLARVEQSMEAVQLEFDAAMEALPDKEQIPLLLTNVSKSGNDAGLEFILFQPGGANKKDFYAEIPVAMKIQGGYHQIAQFFDRVSRLPRIVNIDSISMSYGKGGGLMETSCRAVTYMFIEKNEAAGTKGNKPKRRRKKG